MTRMTLVLISLSLALGCANASKASSADGGNSDGGVAATGRTGHGFVAGGIVAKSASYKLIGTLSSGQGATSSPHYTQHGGVVGATQ